MHECVNRDTFTAIYQQYNRKEFVHPDPLEFLYAYPHVRDREIVGLIASCLAYGNVWQILRTVQSLLERIGPPREFINGCTPESLSTEFADFKYRFTTAADICSFFLGIQKVIRDFGSVENCFKSGWHEGQETILPALGSFVDNLSFYFERKPCHLLPHPKLGSACKRLNLYLRWMIRKDEVDPGGWNCFSADKLIIPVDIHMHRISLVLGLTIRKAANLKTALEITEQFKKLFPDDPVRMDFSLTRFGIRDEMDYCQILTSGVQSRVEHG